MSKFKAPSFNGLVAPAKPHVSAVAQSHNHVDVQLRDEDVPGIDLELPEAPPEPVPSPEAARTKVRGRGNVKAKPAVDEDAGMAHRSLYAKPETLDLIREIAFKERISAQSLYREGLLLMLQARGYYQDRGPDDV